jgi:hypothetical protein
MSELDIKRGRSPAGGHEPRRVEKRAGLMEVCLLSPQCLQRHRQSACDKFKGLSLQQCFGSASGSAWIRIDLSGWIGIRIRNQIADSDPGGQK